MQFNIARIEGQPRRGYDLINRLNGDRKLWVPDSDTEAESTVRAKLGSHAVLAGTPVSDGIVYEVPAGTRSLRKTLKTSPYEKAYMQRLSERAHEFLQTLAKLDTNRFGITVDTLAISHNGHDDSDDAYLCAVPPLLPATPEVATETETNNTQNLKET